MHLYPFWPTLARRRPPASPGRPARRAMRRLAAAAAAAAVVSTAGPGAAWASSQVGDSLGGNGQLNSGDSMFSSNGEYELIMQGDGNLVEYFQGRALWDTGTQGHSGAWAVMQGDGNLVVYSSGGTALWDSGTQGHPRRLPAPAK